jgi:hypothetical protein
LFDPSQVLTAELVLVVDLDLLLADLLRDQALVTPPWKSTASGMK